MEVPSDCCPNSSCQNVTQPSASFVTSLSHNLHALCIIEVEIVASFYKETERVVVNYIVMDFDSLRMDILDKNLRGNFDLLGFLDRMQLFVIWSENSLMVLKDIKEIWVLAKVMNPISVKGEQSSLFKFSDELREEVVDVFVSAQSRPNHPAGYSSLPLHDLRHPFIAHYIKVFIANLALHLI